MTKRQKKGSLNSLCLSLIYPLHLYGRFFSLTSSDTTFVKMYSMSMVLHTYSVPLLSLCQVSQTSTTPCIPDPCEISLLSLDTVPTNLKPYLGLSLRISLSDPRPCINLNLPSEVLHTPIASREGQRGRSFTQFILIGTPGCIILITLTSLGE